MGPRAQIPSNPRCSPSFWTARHCCRLLDKRPNGRESLSLRFRLKTVCPGGRREVVRRLVGRADHLVWCDGGRSLIGKATDIEFPRWDPTTSKLIGEVEVAEKPEWGLRCDALGSTP